MSLDAALRSHLLALTDVSNVIGTRLYSRAAPQGVTAPYVVMLRVSSPGQHNLTGPAAILSPRYQFSCYGTTHAEAVGIASELRGALDGFRGALGSARVRWAGIEDERDLYEDRSDGEQIGLFRTDLDVVFWHSTE